MRDRSITVDWLADLTGIAERTLRRRLSPRAPRGMLVDELCTIADALRVSPGTLLAESERYPGEPGRPD